MSKETKTIKINCTSDQWMTFSDMIPFEDNPRELTDTGAKKLKRSLLEIGIFKPFLIWKKGNRILGGNQRYRVLQQLVDEGYEVGKLPVTLLDVDEGTARLIVVRDNQSDGDWAYEQLATYLKKLEGFGVDKTLSGFTDREFTDLEKLVESGDQLRARLESMASGSGGSEGGALEVQKQFGFSFKVPEDEWAWFEAALKQLREETGSDDLWTRIKAVFQTRFPLPEGAVADLAAQSFEAPKPRKRRTKADPLEALGEA